MNAGTGIAVFLERLGDRRDASQDFPRGGGIGDPEPEALFQRHHELERIDGIESEAFGAEKGLIVPDLGGCHLQHQGLDHEFLELPPEISCFEFEFVGHHSITEFRRRF